MRYRKRLLAFPLTPDQRRFVQSCIARLREEFATDMVHRVRHGRMPDRALLWEQFRLDPMTILALPHHAGQVVARQIKGQAAR